MVVSEIGSFGTIGGGHLEFVAQQQARRLMKAPGPSWRIQDFPLGPLLGQCCGGKVRLLIERLHHNEDSAWLAMVDRCLRSLDAFSIRHQFQSDKVAREIHELSAAKNWNSFPDRNLLTGDFLIEPFDNRHQRVILVGAGHVGSAIVRAMQRLPFKIMWFDTRSEIRDERVLCRPADSIEQHLQGAEASDVILVMTHDHALDFRLIEAGLRGNASFVGLIGSATKRARFFSRLEKSGYEKNILSRLVCPIGLPGISGKDPAVIAASVAAQLLAAREAYGFAN